ncbi:IclR family transcriptional regulator [Roseinatronobacter sp. S2]|uniref:IclR family transcriptional regulator n=1 Tax=Roseinatronobacter sp. S2 TaxID=3035471 RepID=UPI00240FF57C|nr:IclR family transcriptional regulator [Roseinatronobacter sp. S2]WFE74703.1 IclR family transcriptional regulator [Roseinatronobacter sp. S2]
MPPSVSASSGATNAPALRRAVAILDHLADTGTALSMAEISRALGLPKSTSHGLILAMEDIGLVQRVPGGGFRIGSHPLRWAQGFLSQTDLVTSFKAYFAQNRELARFTVTMTVLEHDEVVYIACEQANQPLGVTFRIGMRLPAPFTATGLAQLASQPDQEICRRFDGHFPQPLTEHSLRNVPELLNELEAVRERGFSIDNGQVRQGMICLGTILRDHTNAAVAGIAVSLTRQEATPDVIDMLGTTLQVTAQGISRQLGYEHKP